MHVSNEVVVTTNTVVDTTNACWTCFLAKEWHLEPIISLGHKDKA